MNDEERNLSGQDEQEMGETNTPTPPQHRFSVYNFVVLSLILFIIWVIGQFSPGLPDEQVAQIIGVALYVLYGINIKTNKK